MARITYLVLDSSYDPIFADGASLTDGAAVRQIILTRLKLFMGEWWEALNLGLPVFQLILGKLGSPKGQAAMSRAIQQNVEGSPYVIGVVNVSANFTSGKFSFTATARTEFGQVTVSS